MESILETKASTFLGVLGWITRQPVRDLRGRHLGSLAVRPAQAACYRGSGLQSAQDPRQNRATRVTRLMPGTPPSGYVSMILSRSTTVKTGCACCGNRRVAYLTPVKDLSRVMNRLKALVIAAGPFPARPPGRLLQTASQPVVGKKRPRPEPAAAPSNSISNWTCCSACAKKRDAICSRRVANMPSLPSYGRFRRLDRSVPLWRGGDSAPHRFRSKRQLWTYSGLGLETRDSGEYRYAKRPTAAAQKTGDYFVGLNKDYNHDLKGLFKGTATRASVKPGPFQEFYSALARQGHQAHHGAPDRHVGTQDCSHYADTVEEGIYFDIDKLNASPLERLRSEPLSIS